MQSDAHVVLAGNMSHEMYWDFTINELAEEDVAAQLDQIHVVKCEELGYNWQQHKPGFVSEAVAKDFQRRTSPDMAKGWVPSMFCLLCSAGFHQMLAIAHCAVI